MDRMNYVDVFSSILFEATADSEADSDVNKNMDHALLRDDMGLADDEYDALSCSCDDIIDFKDFDQYEFDLVDQEEEKLEDDKKIFYDHDDVEEGVVEWNGDHKAKENLKTTIGATSPCVLMDEKQGKKLKICADSVKEFMNQRDTDRLFWETCLAS